MTRLANVTNLGRNMQTCIRCRKRRRHSQGLWPKHDRLLDIEGPVTSSAKGIAGPVLHQRAVFAAYNLASLDASLNTRKSSCHRLFADRQSGAPAALFSTGTNANLGRMNHNCQVQTWDQP
jgi:hypothetical protein